MPVRLVGVNQLRADKERRRRDQTADHENREADQYVSEFVLAVRHVSSAVPECPKFFFCDSRIFDIDLV